MTAHQWYALFHALRGNHTESVEEVTRARELAPYSLSIAIDAAEMQYYRAGTSETGSYNDAIELSHRVLDLHNESGNAQIVLTHAYWMHGEGDDFERAVAIQTNDTWKGSPQDYARKRAGPRKGSREFDDIQHPHTLSYARWSAVLNRREEALDLLERAYRDHHFGIIYIKAEPFFKNLHDEPRYQELLQKLGLS
ncbi:MAG: hypothetical protein H7Z38_20765 [Rubrivivax sp.]|nr:hypothetical protein [Pyrinomonadaceae bacterium]